MKTLATSGSNGWFGLVLWVGQRGAYIQISGLSLSMQVTRKYS
jgi:hypothetical protein